MQNLTDEFETELQQLLDLNEISIPCPCGNYTYTDNIFLNMENTFTCEKCNNAFKLIINVTPTLVTEVVDVGQAVTDLTRDVKDVEITSEYKQGTEL